MKPSSSLFLTATMVIGMATPTFAIEGPADDSPPPPATTTAPKKMELPKIKLAPSPQQLGQASPRAAMPQPKPDIAYLGVLTAEVPEMLANHLHLKPGEGVIVRSLVQGGPAAASGIQANDIITQVADQAVGSPAEFSKLIAAHKVGETVSFGLIHEGTAKTLQVKLESRPPDLARGGPQTLDPMNLDGLPKEFADQIRDAIADNIGGTELDDQDGGIHKQMDQALRNMQLQMRGAGRQRLVPPPALPNGKTESHGQSTIRIKDNEGSVEIKSQDGAKQVTLRDAQDQVTWSGPWDTAQDKAAAPDTALRRIEALNFDMDYTGKGMRIRPRNSQPPQGAPGH